MLRKHAQVPWIGKIAKCPFRIGPVVAKPCVARLAYQSADGPVSHLAVVVDNEARHWRLNAAHAAGLASLAAGGKERFVLAATQSEP